MTSEFAIATCDELWSHGVLLDRRLGRGRARRDQAAIVASDDAVDPALVDACEAQRSAMQPLIAWLGDARVRAVASVRGIGEAMIVEATMTVAIRGVSIVTTPEHAMADADFLRSLDTLPPSEGAPLRDDAFPVFWKNGSAAVLLHEAVGHAAEHDAPPVAWPSWLTVRDEPPFDVDDEGNAARSADLLHAAPACRRRASFRDVPLTRMTNVVVRQTAAPFALPDPRIEVQLVGGGSYEPLSGTIAIRVSVADLVGGDRRERLRPFTLRRTRAEVARSLAGAWGEPLRYPGVVCSREGQELVVGSHAPLLVTA